MVHTSGPDAAATLIVCNKALHDVASHTDVWKSFAAELPGHIKFDRHSVTECTRFFRMRMAASIRFETANPDCTGRFAADGLSYTTSANEEEGHPNDYPFLRIPANVCPLRLTLRMPDPLGSSHGITLPDGHDFLPSLENTEGVYTISFEHTSEGSICVVKGPEAAISQGRLTHVLGPTDEAKLPKHFRRTGGGGLEVYLHGYDMAVNLLQIELSPKGTVLI